MSNEETIFGGQVNTGGTRLDLPEAPYTFVRWANTDESTGVKTEHVNLEIAGPVIAYQRRQQWDNENNKPRVQDVFLRDKITPNPRAGEPKMETVHFLLTKDGIVATSIYGTMFGSESEPGPYTKALIDAEFGRFDKVIGMRFAQKFVRLDGQRRVFEFRAAKPKDEDKDRVVAAHLTIVNYLALVAGANGGAQWYRKATPEERNNQAVLLDVIAKRAQATADAITPAPSVAKAAVTAALPLALEAITKASKEGALDTSDLVGAGVASSASEGAGDDLDF